MLLGSLMTMPRDFSLVEATPLHGFEYIRNPQSFRIATLDLSNDLSSALTIAQQKTKIINLNMKYLDPTLRRIMTYLQPENYKEKLKYFPLLFSKIKGSASRTTEAIKSICETFDKSTKHLFELSLTVVARHSMQQTKTKQLDTAIQLITRESESMKQQSEKTANELERRLRIVSKYRKMYTAAVKDTPHPLIGLLAGLFRSTASAVTGFSRPNSDQIQHSLTSSRPYVIDAVSKYKTSFEKLRQCVQDALNGKEQGELHAMAVCGVAKTDFRLDQELLQEENSEYRKILSGLVDDGMKLCESVEKVFSEEKSPFRNETKRNETLHQLLSGINDLKRKSVDAWYKMNKMHLGDDIAAPEEKGSYVGDTIQTERSTFLVFRLPYTKTESYREPTFRKQNCQASCIYLLIAARRESIFCHQ